MIQATLPIEQGNLELGAVYTTDNLASWVAELALAARLPSRSGRVIDPNCGIGNLLAPWAKQAPAYDLYGLDIDPTALDILRARQTDIKDQIVSALPPPGVTLEEHWQTLGLCESFDVVLSNPPWGIELDRPRNCLEKSGFSLAHGQFDSFELFTESAYHLGRPGAVYALILPDSIFYPEKSRFRAFIAKNFRLLAVARLGEGFFSSVYRATTLLLLRKGRTTSAKSLVKCIRLLPQDRTAIFEKRKTLSETASKRCHELPEAHFIEAESSWSLDWRPAESKLIISYSRADTQWTDWVASGRGIELPKSGLVASCPQCNTVQPLPRTKTSLNCVQCEEAFSTAAGNIRRLIQNEIDRNADQNLYRPIYVGESIDRYSLKKPRYLLRGVPGINYKEPLHKRQPRILIRKTGLGLKATIDTSNSYTNQVVFSFYAKGPDVPEYFIFYVLGVLCSRVTLAYFLRNHGETEWKSHPYVTQKIIQSLKIPFPNEKSHRQALAIADAARHFHSKQAKTISDDLFIDCLVAGMYGLTRRDCLWVNQVLGEAEGLEPIRTMRLEAPELLRPHLVK